MHPIHDLFILWLKQYGSFALFGMLALGILALPIPEETLMVFAGVLMRKGKLYLIPTIIAAYGGALLGITVSYLCGRGGLHYFLKKYHEKKGAVEKIEKLHEWFHRFGKWTLFFGYFIPGVRHFTGLAAGIGKLKYSEFALFAYTGGILWVSLFLSIGYFFSQYFDHLYRLFAPHLDLVITLIILGIFFYFWYLLKRKK